MDSTSRRSSVDNLTRQQVSTLFWINLGVGTAITVAVAASAPLVAAFYGEPRLLWISVVLASTFLFGGLTIQHQAPLRRQMRFGDLAWINDGCARIRERNRAGLVRLRHWALVWREVVRTAALAAGVWILCPWKPGRPQQSPEVRSMIQAGGGITGFNIVYFLSRSFDQILVFSCMTVIETLGRTSCTLPLLVHEHRGHVPVVRPSAAVSVCHCA